jgi:HK97 family phage portal protein
MRYPEARLQVVSVKDGTPMPDHWLQRTLDEPNSWMDQDLLKQFSAVDKAIGGNSYIYIDEVARDKYDLFPYNDSVITPIGDDNGWITGYKYDDGETRKTVTPDKIIHLRWPSIDPDCRQKALAPLRMLAKDVDTDNELSRTVFSLLKNDAVARGGFTFPAEVEMEETELADHKARLKQQLSGDAKGDPLVLAGGMTYQRYALNLDELQVEGIRRTPESRIAVVFRTPAGLIGLYTGMESMTYSNISTLRLMHTEGTLVPFWKRDATAFTRTLVPLAEQGKVKIVFDLSDVEALKEKQLLLDKEAREIYKDGLTSVNETRERLRLLPLDSEHGESFATNQSGPIEADKPEQSLVEAEVSTATVLNGAQVAAATAIVIAVASGQLPRDAGVGQLEVLFNLTNAQATQIMGSAGTNTPTTPNPNPNAAIAQPKAVQTETQA